MNFKDVSTAALKVLNSKGVATPLSEINQSVARNLRVTPESTYVACSIALSYMTELNLVCKEGHGLYRGIGVEPDNLVEKVTQVHNIRRKGRSNNLRNQILKSIERKNQTDDREVEVEINGHRVKGRIDVIRQLLSERHGNEEQE